MWEDIKVFLSRIGSINVKVDNNMSYHLIANFWFCTRSTQFWSVTGSRYYFVHYVSDLVWHVQ